MSKEEAQITKRKFRKLWRKAAKQNSNVKRSCKSLFPTKKHKANRKGAVVVMFMREMVNPAIKNYKT
jgi:hypothetical protein